MLPDNVVTLAVDTDLDGEGKVAKLVHRLRVVLAVQLLLQSIPDRRQDHHKILPHIIHITYYDDHSH